MNLKVTKHSSDTLTDPESLNRRAVAQNNPEKKQFLTRAQRDWKPGMKKKSPFSESHVCLNNSSTGGFCDLLRHPSGIRASFQRPR